MHYSKKILLAVFILVALSACRGENEQVGVSPELLDFIETPDPNRFNLFLNPDLATANAVADDTECIGEGCAYYNSIDPEATRDTLDKWLQANGFSSDVTNPFQGCGVNEGCCVVTAEAPLPDSQCTVIMSHASFRDTRDLGYGRDMFMRHDRVEGDVAVFVRNFKFDQALGLPEGLPYGPQNLEALIQDFHAAQFSISAIEFSAFPNTDPQALKFAKFYSFDGASNFPDGRGPRLLRTDIPERGTKVEMPNACSTCHGGLGRSVIGVDGKLTPVLHNGIAGDMQAHLQAIDVNTLQFASTFPFTRSDQEPFIRAVNNAVLHSYIQYRDSTRPKDPLSSYWNPDHSIEFLTSRYDTGPNCESIDTSTPFDCLRGNYRDNFTVENIPDGWENVDQVAFNNLIVPNCLSCHLVKGSYASEGISFHSAELFDLYAQRSGDLVFDRGLMPSSFWNYREFWDLKNPLPLAETLGFPSSVDTIIESNTIVGVEVPGQPVAKISAPPVAQVDSTIVISAAGSAFADQFEWSVTPESAAVIAEPDNRVTEITVSNSMEAETFAIQLNAISASDDCSEPDAVNECNDAASFNITLVDDPVSTATDFFDEAGGVGTILKGTCTACHSDSGAVAFSGIPVSFCSDETDAITVYKSILNRVSLENPTDSLLLRKPSNGVDSLGIDREDTAIAGYHAGGAVLTPNQIATIVNWINAGAMPDVDSASIPASFFSCNVQ